MAKEYSSPLAGKRVVITRAESQAARLAEALRAKGAEPISLPLIQIVPLADNLYLDSTLRELQKFDWLVFTSQNAVASIADRLAKIGSRWNGERTSPKIAAVGRSTAERAEAFGFSVTYTGKGGTAADLIQELANDLRGKRVFLPRSDKAATALINHLQDVGARVTEVVAYRTVPLTSIEPGAKTSVANCEAMLFFSPSAVHAFLNLVRTGVLSSLHENVTVGAIGPVTISALREAGIRCNFQASEPRVEEIVSALVLHFEKTKIASASGVQSR